MIKPYVCVACEKVIMEMPERGALSGTSGPATLVSLFSRITAAVPESAEIPRNAVVPKEWSVYSEWDLEHGDEDKGYVICTQIYYPDGSPFGPTSKSILAMMPDKLRSQNIVRIMGFPIGQPGAYAVHTWIEENEQRILGPIEFKIEFEIQRQPQPQTV